MKTILMIDDDPTELDIMSKALSDAGFKVLVAEDGITGINRAIFAQPDLILLDIMMPGVDGHLTCQEMRKNPRTRNIPIILKTCLRTVDAIKNGFKFGADDFIVKPCDHVELVSRISFRIGKTPRQNMDFTLAGSDTLSSALK